MKLNDIPNNDAARIDKFAWNAIKSWPQAAGFDPIHDGLNFEKLTRWSLWSRVGRAIRSELDPEGFKFEKNLFFSFDKHRPPTRRASVSRFLQNLKPTFAWPTQRATSANRTLAPLSEGRTGQRSSAIFVPHPSGRTEKIAAALIERGYPVVVSPATGLPGYAEATTLPNAGLEDFDCTFADQLSSAVLEGLGKQGIQLLPFDRKGLYDQLRAQLKQIKKASAEIDMVVPRALLIHGDNHYPYQEYVAVANRNRIPTIAFQHGLDCERYYLDDAYCSALAVWSEQRKQRYESDCENPPALLHVTGNPAFDIISKLPEKIDVQGDFILWVTRPHTSSFCYSPSRQVIEGLDILSTLLDAMEKNPAMELVVKPHPQDYAFLYEERIAERSLSDRAKIVTGDINPFISRAKIVISEDSTGGLEAMLKGKILIHSHFAESNPVLPFCDYKAALPGHSSEVLLESLDSAQRLSSSERDEMLIGQRNFITDYAGELDGRAEDRLISFCEAVVNTGPGK